ncbi:MAG: AraC family transcriptional regulator, partial [Ruminococcus sp.]|nr:AraC family transcriptional regulator [Ruminococcus sp.]
LPIRQVALAVGYENTSYFYHIFEERFGMPPQKMQKE